MRCKLGKAAGAAAVLALWACGPTETASSAGAAAAAADGGDAGAVDGAADAAVDSPKADAGAPDGTTADAQAADASGATLDRCKAVIDSVLAAGFDSEVKVSCDGTYAWIEADTDPDHALMDGITGTNDQVPIPAPGYRSPVTLHPKPGSAPVSIDAALGIAVNGVPIYDYSSQGVNDLTAYDAKFDTKLTGELDVCNGHSGRGDDYHYHAAPICMIAMMKNKGPGAILGWAFDGYPIFGNDNPDGSAIAKGELDVCNGKADPTYGYRYHTSDGPPYIIQCLKGAFDVAGAPKVPPLTKLGGGGGRPPGKKPPGGVQNLKLIKNPDGSRKMTYEHQGKSYFIDYKPATTAGCWDFSEQTYTSGGSTQQGTYCRKPW